MKVLLLLAACVCTGLSYDTYDEVFYGYTYRMRLHRKAVSIKFIQSYSSDATILWKRDDPPASEDSRRMVVGAYYVIENVTQRDSGNYIMSDKDGKVLSKKNIEVKARTWSYALKPGQRFNHTFYLEPDSCNIYFLPESDHEWRKSEIEIVHKGRLREDLGMFEVRDHNNDKAWEITLEMEPLPFDPSHLYTGIIVAVAVLSCCCCMRCCCCKKRSSKSPETPAEPAVYYHKYDTEPAVLKSDQHSEPSGTHYSAQPSYAPTGPLIHNPPTVNVPSAYSKVSAPAEPADTPTIPLCSDPEPLFELKGINFSSALPLNSDSGHCDVYTSDKLNFL
ncbi:uncharacterized protein AKAME5_001866100 [Lates japonicus]|uniref:Uncharacterized protein n=1 Tax=Lates japonicus TaxID=270547 RepID=A0AAD3RGB2_LATJO|nr:uncharacterized protein AKAME5_001866100 [Lates japonicus]